jgi:hypothetical protein
MATYTNLGIQQIVTGTEAGTWGTITNTNFDYFDTAITGSVDVTLAATGSTSSPNALNVQDYTVSDGRNRAVQFIDSGTSLGGTCYVRITKNGSATAPYFNGYYFVRNSLTTQDLVIFQGTYSSGNAVTVPNGTDSIIKCVSGVLSVLYTKPVFTGLTVNGTSTTAGIFAMNRPNGGTNDTTLWTSACVAPTTSLTSGILYSAGSNRSSWSCNGYRNLNNQWTTSAVAGSTGAALIELDPTGFITFSIDASKSTGSAPNPTERMRITSAGNVGIGTNAPTEKLHVVGNGYVTGTLTSGGNIGGNITAISTVGVAGGSTTTTSTSYGIAGYDSASAFMFGARGDGALIVNGAKTESPAGTGATTVLAANMYVASSVGTSQILRSTSSIRYKHSIEDATYGLNEVMQLRPVTYKGNNDGDIISGGFIAEEIDIVDKMKPFVVYDEEGRPDALNYANMVSLLTKAIQEQQAMIEDLKARVAALGG